MAKKKVSNDNITNLYDMLLKHNEGDNVRLIIKSEERLFKIIKAFNNNGRYFFALEPITGDGLKASCFNIYELLLYSKQSHDALVKVDSLMLSNIISSELKISLADNKLKLIKEEYFGCDKHEKYIAAKGYYKELKALYFKDKEEDNSLIKLFLDGIKLIYHYLEKDFQYDRSTTEYPFQFLQNTLKIDIDYEKYESYVREDFNVDLNDEFFKEINALNEEERIIYAKYMYGFLAIITDKMNADHFALIHCFIYGFSL